MNIEDFSYPLPTQLIANYPLATRSASRLLVLNRINGEINHHSFIDLIQYLTPCDLLIFNNTKVIPARLFGTKLSGGKIEILVERILDTQHFLAHLKKSRALKKGMRIVLNKNYILEIIDREENLFKLKLVSEHKNLWEMLEEMGEMPLPLYIKRRAESIDKQRYQTIYAAKLGAVAAPTAGLHFDEKMMQLLTEKKINFGFVTLHVGAGTFKPVTVDNIIDHKMHSEYFEIGSEICEKIHACKKNNGRVIAVGTTVVRSIETLASNGGVRPFQGETNCFIYPGYEFKCVDAVLTNFHFPKSTLLMLVAAFAGREKIMQAYHEAIENNYRFYSYGDAMLII